MDNQKLLPSAKSSSAIVRRASGGNFIEKLKSVETNKNDNQEKSSDSSNLVEEVKVIKDRVEEIKGILNNTISIQQNQRDIIRKQEEQDRRQKKEDELEKREKKPKKDNKLPEVPKMGILDRINRFITFTLLGFFAVRLIKHLPKILEFIKKLTPVISFIETLAGAFFEGVVNFIDAGYKAYDTVREFTKSIGGEGFQKAFDDFSSKLNLFANLAIIAGMAAMSKGFDDDSNTKGKVNKRGFSKDGRRVSKSTQTRYAQRYGRDKFIQKFGKENLKNLPKSLQRSGLEKASRKAAVGVLGKGGTKAVLKFAKPFLNRLPLIGGLIDFGLSVALGESPGRAAFKAIGATILGAIGTGFGGPLGAIIGGFAGDWAGGKLYDIFFGNKTNVDDKSETVKKQGGGKVPPRRKGSSVGRKISRKIKRNIVPPKPKRPKIGSSIGGEKKVKLLFPESKDNSNVMNPFGIIKTANEKLTEIPFVGPLFSIFGKTLLGDSPNKSDYQIVGKAFNAWINSGIEKGSLTGSIVRAFAEGGAIEVERQVKKDISGWVEKSIEDLAKNKITDIINEFRKNIGLKPLSGSVSGGQPPLPSEESTTFISGGDADFWTLVAVASREDGDPQAWADVAQSIYNRLGSGAYSGKSIKELILGRMQYEPTWKFPKPGQTGIPNPEWRDIKDAQSASAASGQSVAALSKVASAILDPTLQKNAKEFIQGRTDFRGYSVSGGIQRKNGDNYFGWYNNYTQNKIAKVPNFGATSTTTTATTTGSGPGPSGGGGSYTQLSNNPDAKKGSKLAGELGRFLDKKGLGKWGSGVHQHPEHPAWSPESGHSPGSLHYASKGARAIDIGGFGPNLYRARGYTGVDDQTQILAGIEEFNRMKGVKPVQLLKEGYPGHANHVHVAYEGGGLINPPQKDYKTLKNQASYDKISSSSFILPIYIKEVVPVPMKNSSQVFFSGSSQVNSNNNSSLFR